MTTELPWPFAGRVAGLIAGTYPLAESYHIEHLELVLPPMAERACRLVEEETGLSLPGRPEVVIVSRREWVDRNISTFSHLLEPAERSLAHRLERIGAEELGPTLARRMVALETGVLLGFMARRVLGQYELVLPTGEDSDSIAFVGANILEMERRHQFLPAEFRLWLALHEVTHRAQFVGVDWMREHFLRLVEEMIAASEPEDGKLRRIVTKLIEQRRKDIPLIDERGLLGLFSTPAQLSVLDRIQALMSLLEGHGHVVMDRIGSRVLTSGERMSSVLKARRADPRTAAFFRLSGLEMKMRQYQLGEHFVLEVERLAGWPALSAAWESPAALPALAEIHHPEKWLDRVA